MNIKYSTLTGVSSMLDNFAFRCERDYLDRSTITRVILVLELYYFNCDA